TDGLPCRLGEHVFGRDCRSFWNGVLTRRAAPSDWPNHRKPRTKAEIALAEIDRVIAAGVQFGCVLADAGYGPNSQFRNGLTARKLTWAVGIPCQIRVYAADVKMIWPVARAQWWTRKRRLGP